jgi:hypothetical protein
MEILGIGLQELIFIGLILLLILGPTELVSLGRKTGRFVRRVRESDTWIMIANLANALRNLPSALADEAGAEEIFRNVVPNRDHRTIAPPGRAGSAADARTGPEPVSESGYSAWTTPPAQESDPSGRTDEPSAAETDDTAVEVPQVPDEDDPDRT